MRFILILLSCFIHHSASVAQQATSSDIYESIEKLRVLGSVMFLAAHPDDENTRLIAHLANERMVETVYLSLTRGDGGQNLIGTELRDLLGVIRTQELLAARSIDGGKQFFSRANDFGYSKSPEESLEIWGENEVLKDVVWAIRKFKPDVIVNRFNHVHNGRTHGHHTASAMLSYDAFDMAGRKNIFPDQLSHHSTWSPERMYFNTSWWFYGSREAFAEADKKNMAEIDIGNYYPIKGLSNNEVAAQSRSMHRCQGFGSAGSRGSQIEYLEFVKGNNPKDKNNILDGINTTWSRVQGGEKIGQKIQTILDDFTWFNPSKSVPQLIALHKELSGFPRSHWVVKKQADLEVIIQDCLGLFIRCSTPSPFAAREDSVDLTFEFVNRSDLEIMVEKINLTQVDLDTIINIPLDDNQKVLFEITSFIPANAEYSSPYWINDKSTEGMFEVDQQELVGQPENTPLSAQISLTVNGSKFLITRPVMSQKTDPVRGELLQPLAILPVVGISFQESAVLFNDYPREVVVNVKTFADNQSGTAKLVLPEGWVSEPKEQPFSSAKKGLEIPLKFVVSPKRSEGMYRLFAEAKVGENTYDSEVNIIEYDHIPTQYVVKKKALTASFAKIKIIHGNIGYIMGPGDKIPECLRQLGFPVTVLSPGDINARSLAPYDVIITGIRAYNTEDHMKFSNEVIFDFVKKGGTLISQYNTRHRLKTDKIGPYPITLSRDRVTVESAPVIFTNAEHSILNYPNKITTLDFDDWVQERGLYFPGEWSEEYQTIIQCNDPEESPKAGSILSCSYGEGQFIYTGLSFFRQLPAGVPGAYRLFSNMIAIGRTEQP